MKTKLGEKKKRTEAKNWSCKQLMSFMWFSSLFRGYTVCGFPRHSKGCFILFSRFQRINNSFLYVFSLLHFKPNPHLPSSPSHPLSPTFTMCLCLTYTSCPAFNVSISLRSSAYFFHLFPLLFCSNFFFFFFHFLDERECAHPSCKHSRKVGNEISHEFIGLGWNPRVFFCWATGGRQWDILCWRDEVQIFYHTYHFYRVFFYHPWIQPQPALVVLQRRSWLQYVYIFTWALCSPLDSFALRCASNEG